ncbi:hypothetical protein AGDE_00018 [Angomonas deanei]|nr:hypothetical protein AGDE_00018 [Angomonas deanei]|eukprot:EPY43902.1 hypothetical protein AGDE_00018 [Angomonas deanei]
MGDNIWSFDTQGMYLGEVINNASFPSDVKVGKLRSMRFGPGGHLYVGSASGSYSRIFAVSGNGLLNETLNQDCTRDYLFTVASQTKADVLLDHPYDFVFHPETNDLYVSNQNSITITRYTYKTDDKKNDTWVHAPNVKFAIPSKDIMGTDAFTNILPDGLPDASGLFASSWSDDYALSSVRGIALSPPLPPALVDGLASPGYFASTKGSLKRYLLVCDVAASTVHVFDSETGERLFGLYVPSPVQVAFPNAMNEELDGNSSAPLFFNTPYVYVTSKEDGMMYMVPFAAHSSGNRQRGYDLDRFARTHALYSVTDVRVGHSISGFYENPSRGVLLIADRTGRKIYTYASPYVTESFRLSSGPSPYIGKFANNLPDQPEFILSVLLEHQKNVPFCYELAADGTYRYVALCAATYGWTFLFTIALILIPTIFVIRKVKKCFDSDSQRKSTSFKNEDAPLLGGGEQRLYGSTR